MADYFRVRGHGDDDCMKLVDDHDLRHLHPPRRHTIGASSEPYGAATVEVRHAATQALVNVVSTHTTNHVLVTGLTPDTEYIYTILLNGEEWAAGERRDWVAADDGAQGLQRCGRVYTNRFRTHPQSTRKPMQEIKIKFRNQRRVFLHSETVGFCLNDVPFTTQTRLHFDVILPLWGRRGTAAFLCHPAAAHRSGDRPPHGAPWALGPE